MPTTDEFGGVTLYNNSGKGSKNKNKGILNPAFDQRLTNIGVPSHRYNRLKRGSIKNADSGGLVRFLYNPTSINVNHSADPNTTYNPETIPDVAAGTTGDILAGFGTTSVALLYDRTYEVWDREKKNPASRYGVYADVHAMYRLFDIVSDQTELTGGTGKGTWSSLYPDQPLTRVNVWFYFGDTIKYYGYVTGLDVTYTHFSVDLIPTRAVMNVGIALQPPPGKRKSTKDKNRGGL